MSPTVPPTSVITTSTSSVGEAADAPLDLVGDVRDHLHGLAEVVAAPLGGQHGLVDRAGRGVRVLDRGLVDEALVVPEVEVGLATVVGDEHLAVLERVHRARVDVDVRVELLHRDPQAPGLEQPPERRGREALAQAGSDTTGHEDVFGPGGVAVGRAGQHARQLDDPLVAEAPWPTVVVTAAVVLGDLRPAIRRARDLGQVGDDEHLAVVARAASAAPTASAGRRRCRRRPRRTRGSGASVRRTAEHQAQRQHRPGQLAAGGHLGQRQQRRTGVGGEEEARRRRPARRHGPRPRASPSPWPARPGARQWRWQGRAQPRGRPPPRRRGRPSGASASLAIEGCRALVVRLELRQAAARLAPELEHLGQGLAVLAAQVVQQLAALAHRGQSLGVVVDPLAERPQLRRDVGELGGHARRRSVRRRTAAAGERGDRVAERVGGAAFGGERLDRGAAAASWCALASASSVLLGSRASSSSGSACAADQLVDLEPQQVDLAGPGPLVATERGQRRVDRPTLAGAASSGLRSTAPNRSSAARCTAAPSSDWWACWPCRSTRRSPHSASADAGASRPFT